MLTLSPPQVHQLTHFFTVSPPRLHQLTDMLTLSPPQVHQLTHFFTVSPPQLHQLTDVLTLSPPQVHQLTHFFMVSPPQFYQLSHLFTVSPPQFLQPFVAILKIYIFNPLVVRTPESTWVPFVARTPESTWVPFVVRTPESTWVRSWPERPNQPKYRGTFKLHTAKLCHQIMAIYFSSSHIVMLKFHWQPSTFCNAGYFRCYIASIAMWLCSRTHRRTPFPVLLVMIATQWIYFQPIRLNSNICCGDEKHGRTHKLSKTMCLPISTIN